MLPETWLRNRSILRVPRYPFCSLYPLSNVPCSCWREVRSKARISALSHSIVSLIWKLGKGPPSWGDASKEHAHMTQGTKSAGKKRTVVADNNGDVDGRSTHLGYQYEVSGDQRASFRFCAVYEDLANLGLIQVRATIRKKTWLHYRDLTNSGD